MKYLGIDYGAKRIGLATSDSDGRMAFPYGTVANTSKAVEAVARVCREEKVGHIVVGESVSYKGTPNAIMEDTRSFASRLSDSTNLSIDFHPEILTTQEARRYTEADAKVDAQAAAIMLQSYLDKKNG